MLYLVAHSFFNGQSKNSNLFPLPELNETQFKNNGGALGTRMELTRLGEPKCLYGEKLARLGG